MKTSAKLLLVLFFGFAFTAFAQKADYSKEPGYVDFGDLSQFDTGENVTEILIEKHLLKMVSKIAKEEDPELSALISELKLIKVHTFVITEQTVPQVKTKFNSIDNDLTKKGWDRIVKVRGKSENVNVFIKTADENDVQGLVITTIDGNEAVFVNIIGKINMEQLGKLASKFDIPSLNGIPKNGQKGNKNEKE